MNSDPSPTALVHEIRAPSRSSTHASVGRDTSPLTSLGLALCRSALGSHDVRALLALALKKALRPHLDHWRAQGFELGLGIGIATGFATMATVGYEGRWEYAAIGTVTNLAARLCSQASDGQIVVSKRFLLRVGDGVVTDPLGERTLKGFSKPMELFSESGLSEPRVTMATRTPLPEEI